MKDGTTYKIIQNLDKKNIEVEDENTKRRSIVSEPELVNCLFEGKLRFFKTEAQDSDNTPSCPDLSTAKDEYSEIAILHYELIKPLLKLSNHDRTREKVKERINQITSDPLFNKITMDGTKRPHIATVYRWIRAYERNGNDIRALVPSYQDSGARGEPRTRNEVEELIKEGIENSYYRPSRPTRRETCDDIQDLIVNANKTRPADDQLPLISYPTITRRINALNLYDATKHRYDTIEAEKQFGTKGAGLKPTRPLEIAEIDHTPLDLFVVDDDNRNLKLGRPHITYMIDKYSRYPLGFYVGFNKPSYLSVMYCLYHAISPKTNVSERYPEIKNTWSAYGVPETLIVDNGKEFHSISLESACLQLNINLQYSPGMMPWYKGTMERAFGTLNQDLLNTLPGKSFSSYDKRGSYDSVEEAKIPFKEFIEILHTWIIDKYCKKFHRGIKNVPQTLWDTGTNAFPVNLPYRKEELIVLLGELEARTLTNKGIEFNGLFYNSRELTRMKNSYPAKEAPQIQFKYNPDDISRIWVFNRRENRYIEVEANEQKYTKDLSLWKHEINISNVKKIKANVNMQDLRDADARINKIVEEAKIERSKKGKASPLIAKFDQISSRELPEKEQKNNTDDASVSVNVIPQPATPNSGNENYKISDIGTEYNNVGGTDSEENISDLEKTGQVSSKDITIVEDQDEKPVKERTKVKQTQKVPHKETSPVRQRKTKEKEFDMTGWEVSSKND
ncbi:MAG: transposase family protein [Candidatus Methanoperedens sp.]|nr:transposase family protein [Candidatus Methanoperedens sp.]